MEFVVLIRDMQIWVICKFEMLIFKGSQVIKYYVMFAFVLYRLYLTPKQQQRTIN